MHPSFTNLFSIINYLITKQFPELYRAFHGCVGDLSRIRDRLIHTFGTLGHDLYGWDDFGQVIDVLTDL